MTVRVSRRAAALIVGGAAASLVLAACGGGGGGSSSSSSAPAPTSSSASPTADPACAPYAAYAGHEGTKVTLLTSILPPEQQKFEDAWKQFESCTGIDIVYEGSDQFETLLQQRIDGGQAPDIAFIPQPGLLATLVGKGAVVAAPEAVAANVDKYWNPAWKTYGTVDGTFYAAPLGSNMKSFVWYSPKVFADKGYAVPQTWDELFALSDKMVADGVKPWCGGIESGVATGWPSTDWLEQIVLRQSGGEVYDKWVSHEIPFDSPEIKKAMDTLAGWMKNPDYVNAGFGDVKTIATTAFQDAGKPILDAKCGMLQQASFYSAQWASFKADVTIAEDGDVFAFYLPAIDDAVAPTPVVGGGEFVAAFADRGEVGAVQAYLSSAEFATSKVELGGWVSANNGVPLDKYTDPINQLSAQYLADQTGTFRFDASDLMPAAVGAGAEWKQMTAWFAEDKPTDAVLKAIDAAWPS